MVLDQRVSNLIRQLFHMINPFIDKLKPIEANQGSFMNRVINRKPPDGQGEQRNVFKIPTIQNNEDRENNKNAGNASNASKNMIAQAPPAQPKPEQKSEPKPSKPAAIESFSKATDKAQLEVKVSGQACEVSKIKNKQLKNVTQFTQQNIKITVPASIRQSISREINSSQLIQSALSSLYEVIRDNNQIILSIIRRRNDFRPRKDQHDRLKQGLFYYYPLNNHAMQIFKFALQNHTFYKLTHLVAQRCSLDMLKAYYVVRSVHEQRAIIKQDLPTFFIDHSIQPLPEGEALRLSQSFLENDKNNLLQVYSEVLNCSRSSRLRIFKYREELDILWGNLFNISKETLKNQQSVIEIFLKYWHVSQDDFIDEANELWLMRQKILSLKVQDTLRAKVIAVGIDRILKQGRGLNQNDFEGPFRELFKFFLQRNEREFKFNTAFENLKKIEVSKQWYKYIQTYISGINFIKNQQQNLPRCLYIYSVLMKLKQKGIQLPLKLQEELIIKIMKSCSIIMAIIYLDNLCTNISTPSLINFLTKSSEKDLKLAFLKESSVIFQHRPPCSFQHLVGIKLSLIQRIITNAIDSGDIQQLERQISGGKVYWINLDEEGESFQFMKCYCLQLIKFPSFQHLIQNNIIQLLAHMKQKGLKINRSMQSYHTKLLASSKHPRIFAKHLTFLFQTVQNATQLQQYSKEWLQKAEALGIAAQFDNFAEIACMLGQKVIESDQYKLLQIYLSLIQFFDEEIMNLGMKDATSLQAVRMFHTMSKVSEWAAINSISTPSLTNYLTFMKQNILKSNSSITQFMKVIEPLSSSAKLFMLCQHIPSSDDKLSNSLNKYLSLNEEWKHNIYNKIMMDLQNQSGVQVVQTLSIAALRDGQLLQRLLLQNISNLKNCLKDSSINLCAINYQLNIGLAITNSCQILNKQSIIILKMIVYRVIYSCKDKQLPPAMFAKLFTICAESMNRVEYETHMECLSLGLDQQSVEMGTLLDEHFCQLILYLLCLFITKLKKIDLQGIDESQQLRTQIKVFSILANMTLQANSIHSLNILFLSKYLQILQFFLKFPLMFELVCHHFHNLKSSFQARPNSSTEMNHLLPMFDTIEMEMEKQRTFHSLRGEQSIIGTQQHILNRQVKYLFHSIAKNKEIGQRKDQIKRILSLISENKNRKIKLNYPINLQTMLAQKTLFFINFVHILTKNISWQHCSREVTKSIKIYLSDFDIKQFPVSEHSWMSAVELYIAIFTQLIDSSTFSPFMLFTSIIRDKIIGSLHQFGNGINLWMLPPTDEFLSTLNNIELELNYIPMSWKCARSTRPIGSTFTIWNLLVYRQKLELIKTIIRFYRVMNGLLPSSCIITSQFIPFFTFLAENMDILASSQSADKISAANTLLQHVGRKNAEYGSSLHGEISLTKLKHACIQIGQNLKYLNFELSPRSYEILDKLSRQENH